MIPWQTLGQAVVPGEQAPLILQQRGEEFAIRIGGIALMSSLMHGSEEILAERACARIAGRADACVLVGGLGMGYTLRAALRPLAFTARVVVAELIPAVVEWNRGPLAHLAEHPLADPRVSVHLGDIAGLMRTSRGAFDAILMDVDNGPKGLTRAANDWIYSAAGLRAAFDSLRPGGVYGVWSVHPDAEFTRRLARAGFDAEEEHVRARRNRGGRHTLWFATRRR